MRIKPNVLLCLNFLSITAFCHSSWAEDSLDDLLGAFDDDTFSEDIIIGSSTNKPLIEGLTGSVALSTVYNLKKHSSLKGTNLNRTNWKGFSKLRGRVNLQYDQDLNEKWNIRASGYAFYDGIYSLRDRDEYSNDVLDDYEKEAEVQEFWLRGKINSQVDIKIGRQVVNWGRADSLRVLDILNPLDNREPGLADIEDLRLPVTMIKTDYYMDTPTSDGDWNASFIIIPEIRFSKNAPQGSDFEIAGSYLDENKPEHISDSSFAAALNGIYSGWDISFHAARYWRDTPYVKPQGFSAPTFEHSRLTLLGMGGNYTSGGWLLKGELAWIDGMDFTVYSPNPGPIPPPALVPFLPTATTEKNRIDALIGIEYFGIANTSFSVEVAHQYIPDFEESMKPGNEERNTTGLALRATHSMINDSLDLTAVIFGNFGEAGGGARFDADYDLKDALSLSGGVIFYLEGNTIPFNSYYRNDRLFAELKYSF